MKTLLSTLLTVFVLGFAVQSVYAAGEIKPDSLAAAKKHFATAKGELEGMLAGRQALSYERAIYLLENAYWEGTLNAADFSETLDGQIARIRSVLQANRNPKGYMGTLGWMETEADRRAKYEKAMTNFAIFTYLTDTTFFVEKDGKMRYHLPLRYTHKDPMGSIAWPNTQVTNLLQNGHGNCFALASLYYIFSERLNADARLCTAPGHLYINHPDDKGTRFNVELSSGTFPGNGTIMTQSYATMEAVKSGIALRELSRKQAVALTLVYLAKGYAHKFGTTSDAFVLSCAESALRADSLNLNALLLKAEVLENRLLTQGSSVAQLQGESDFQDYNSLLAKLYRLGYREMPLEMKNILMAGFQRDTLPYKTRIHTSQPFKKYGMENNRHASLSWGLFDEMHETKATERFGNTLFDTKSRKITGFAKKETLYNDYDFDPVAFAWNVDPLASKLPSWSPYVFCKDNPILNFDPDGAFPYSVHVRSFAPFQTFGFGFSGDNRGYSTTLSGTELNNKGGVTSRVQQAFTVDPTAHTFSGGKPWSDVSHHPLLGSTTASDKGGATALFKANAAYIGAAMAAANPLTARLGISTPDIDVNSGIKLTENLKTGILSVEGRMSGDKFPSAEMFIGDKNGQQIMIATSAYEGGPFTSLKGDNNRAMGSGKFDINIDNEGGFLGVTSGERTYSPAAWNQIQTSQPTGYEDKTCVYGSQK